MQKNNLKFTFTDYIPFFQIGDKKKFLKGTNIVNRFDFKKFCRNSSINTSTVLLNRSLVNFMKFKKLKKT